MTTPSEAFQAAYAHLLRASERLVQSGRVRPDQGPGIVADQLWSCVHGFVTVELGGHFSHRSDPVLQVLQPMVVSAFVGIGDDADLAQASHSAVLGP